MNSDEVVDRVSNIRSLALWVQEAATERCELTPEEMRMTCRLLQYAQHFVQEAVGDIRKAMQKKGRTV